MNTQKTLSTERQETIKGLFQELFQLQMELEKFKKLECCFHRELNSLIRVIDRLMQILMNVY